MLDWKLRNGAIDGQKDLHTGTIHQQVERGRREYNQVRPHSAKNYRQPAPEAILTMTTT